MATNVSTIGSATRDYSTIQAWEDATDVNLISAKDIEVGECYNDSEFSVSTTTTITGATTSASYYRKLTAASGESFQDHADAATNALKYNQSNGVGIACTTGYLSAVLYINEKYLQVERLQISSTHGSSSEPVQMHTSSDQLLQNCIFQGAGSQGAGNIGGGTDSKTINCLFRLTGSGKAFITGVGGSGNTLKNCTFVADSDLATAPTNAISTNYSATFVNCAAFGATGLISGGTSSYTTCGTDVVSPPSGWTGSLTYADQFEGTTAAGADFRLKSGSDLEDAGTTDTDATPDIIGTTRSSYDIGCWEFVAAGNTEGVGAAPAVGDAPAIGKATGRGVGTAPAVGDAPAVGKVTGRGVGAALAVGDAPAVGKGTTLGVGAANAVGDAPAIGAATGRGVGAAPAVGDAPAIGKATARGVGAAPAVGDAPAVAASVGSVGAADAVGDAPAVGRSDARGVGTATATGDAPAVGSATARGVGAAAAVGDAPAVGKATGSGVGAAPAVGDAPAVGSATARGVGAAPAVGDAPAVGQDAGGPTTGVGAANAVGDAPAVGASTARAVGTADAIGDALGISPAAVAATLAAGVRRHGFLRRGPKLPWEEDDQEKADEQVVVSKSKRRKVKLPQVVREAVADAIPVETGVTIDAPQIKIPGVGTAKLQIADSEEEALILALLH